MDIARVRWNGKRRFVGTDAYGRSIVMDSKAEHGGDGSGIRPMELVLHGLAGCTAMDVISILEKKRQDVRGLEVIIQGEQRVEEYPKIYTRIEIEYVVEGFGVSEAAVERAIQLSEDKYCSVRGMLMPDIEVMNTYKVLESRPPGNALLEKTVDAE